MINGFTIQALGYLVYSSGKVVDLSTRIIVLSSFTKTPFIGPYHNLLKAVILHYCFGIFILCFIDGGVDVNNAKVS